MPRSSPSSAANAPHYSKKVDAEWVQSVADYGRQIYAEKISVPAYIEARMQAASRITARIVERYAEDQDKQEQLLCAFQRLGVFEVDIILAQVALLEAIEAAEAAAAKAPISSAASQSWFVPAPSSRRP